MHTIQNAGLFILGVSLLAFAIYSLNYAIRESDEKSKLSGLVGFLSLVSVAIVLIGLSLQLWGMKC